MKLQDLLNLLALANLDVQAAIWNHDPEPLTAIHAKLSDALVDPEFGRFEVGLQARVVQMLDRVEATHAALASDKLEAEERIARRVAAARALAALDDDDEQDQPTVH